MLSFLFFLCFSVLSVYSNEKLSGVLNLGVLDSSDSLISKASAFVVFDELRQEKYIVTSFHVLNKNLLIAESIVDLSTNEKLDILAYDEEYDVLILSTKEHQDDFFYISKSCSKSNLLVTGYYKDKLRYANVLKARELDVYESGILSIDTYLPKGFSGSPVLNNQALLCGMVVLSSEGNSSSIYVASYIIERIIREKIFNKMSVSKIRKDLDLEIEVSSNAELKEVLKNKNKNKQKLIVLNPFNPEEVFKVSDNANFIIKSRTKINGISLTNVNNAMLLSLSTKNKVLINQSKNISIVASNFISDNATIDITSSSNLDIKSNRFRKKEAIFISEDTNNYKLENNFVY
jgi:hypothetical protein